jgi:L-rhamnonate dehydratase
MRIKSVRAVQPGMEYSPKDWRTWMGQILVMVETADGLTGYGVGGGGKAGIHIIDTALRALLIGADATNVEDLWDEMYRGTMAFGRKGIAIMAISGVDLALWDLRAKRAEIPLVELLGGRVGESVRTYKTVFSAPESIDAVDREFSAVKMHAGVLPGEDLGDIVGGIARVRETVGSQIEIMGDACMKMDVETTLSLAEQLEPYDLLWLEEPLPPDDLEGYARLRDECPIPIAGGEHEFTAKAFEPIIAEKLHAYVQPDVCWCGGMTELLKIYDLAEDTDVIVCPHRGAEAWSLHAVAARAKPFAESGREWMPWVKGTPEIVSGKVALSNRPGFGVWFDERDTKGGVQNL